MAPGRYRSRYCTDHTYQCRLVRFRSLDPIDLRKGTVVNKVADTASPFITIAVRRSARIISALILLFWSFFIVAHLVGEEGRSSRPLMTSDYVSLTAMVISLAGLAVAWKWENIGAAITLGAVLVGAILNWRSLVFPGSLTPLAAFLFLICWWMSRMGMKRKHAIPNSDFKS